MKVLITGATSFVGCHLASGFQAAGHCVVAGVSVAGEAGGIRGLRLGHMAERGVALRPLDLMAHEQIARAISEEKPDLWIQHAGYTKAYGSEHYDLAKGLAINVLPLGAIFEAMAAIGGRVIVTGTISEYSDSDAPHREDECCRPATAYGLAKLAETLRAEQLSRERGVPTRIARVFLPFGPLDNPEKLLSSLVSSLRACKRIGLSPCLQQRDFLHVEDVVTLYLALANDLDRGGCDIFNVCAGESPRLRDFVLEIAAVLGADPGLCDFEAIPMRPGEAMVIRGSCDKARSLLDWSPTPWRAAVRRFLERPTAPRHEQLDREPACRQSEMPGRQIRIGQHSV